MAATRQKGKNMKQGIHPDYKEVVFLDVSNNFSFKTRSTIVTKETIKWEDGQEYPLAKIETSSESHPFYTGTQKIMDTAGRVEKFRQKFGAKASAKKSVLRFQGTSTKRQHSLPFLLMIEFQQPTP